ncbi:hypothetical protein OXPF_29140 [Oxobacter pfennigii]|uniref:Uncharacterized protein n=1 Tax=Oxobacter pfennigii TaxID=36849 RepID=A0A0P8WLW1_9CLOT|nr:hypothetical protein OXPF_29140 [Oxobacter pfennigii]
MPVNSFHNFPMSWKPHINNNKKPLYKMPLEAGTSLAARVAIEHKT